MPMIDTEKNLIAKSLLELSELLNEKANIAENLSNPEVQYCIRALNIETGATAELIFDMIASYLFFSSSDDGEVLPLHISNEKALVLLTVLVTYNPSKLLKFASRAIYKCVCSIPDDRSITSPSPQLISVITMQLVGDDVEVTSNASKSIVALCKHSPSCFISLFIPPIVDIWQANESSKETSSQRNKLSTICVRCATTIVEISVLSNEGMNAFVSSGASSLFLNMLIDSTDPLVQVSAMDLLELIASIVPNFGSSLITSNRDIPDISLHRQRCTWLFSDEVLSFLLQAAGASQEVEADPFLGGQALKIISLICPLAQYDNEIASSLGSNTLIHQFQMALVNYDHAHNETSRISFIDAVSSFAASSVDAFDTVLQNDILIERWLSLSVSKPKIKSIVLLSVARLLDPSSFLSNPAILEEPQNLNSNSSSLNRSNRLSIQSCTRLYQLIGQVNRATNDLDATTEILLSQARSPMPEVRIASYALMKALVKSGSVMGVRLLLNNAVCFEFLLNRDLESTKEGKEAKYDVVDAIMKTDGIQNMLEDSVVNAFSKYLKQGPHFVQPRRWDHDLM